MAVSPATPPEYHAPRRQGFNVPIVLIRALNTIICPADGDARDALGIEPPTRHGHAGEAKPGSVATDGDTTAIPAESDHVGQGQLSGCLQGSAPLYFHRQPMGEGGADEELALAGGRHRAAAISPGASPDQWRIANPARQFVV